MDSRSSGRWHAVWTRGLQFLYDPKISENKTPPADFIDFIPRGVKKNKKIMENIINFLLKI